MTEYPRHYFEDEVREGFYITGMLKRIWAAQMEVLSDIDRVCRRHNIKWFADCGTLMGAVRHGGYIPWDDDLDICMLRDDYERFLKYAVEEMPKDGYFVFNLHFDEFYEQFLSRVTNGHGLNFKPEFLEKYHDCYLPIGVDVFPIDYLSTNEQYEEGRFEVANQMFIGGDSIKEDDDRAEEYDKLLTETEKLLGKKYDRTRPLKQQFYEAADDVFALVSPKDAEYAVLMPYWLKDKSHKYPLSCFRETVRVPFENSELPVPVEYDRVLKIEYGDYMRLVKAGGVHEYPFFEKMEENLIGMVDNYLLKYNFDPKHLKNEERDTTGHIKAQVGDYLSATGEAHAAVVQVLAQGNAELCLELLAACQESTIQTGNLVEKAYGEGYAAVSAMETYCESIYELYNAIAGGEFGPADAAGVQAFLDGQLEELRAALTLHILDKKEMVFIPYRADYWDGMASMWEEAVSAGEYTVSVIPIPYYK
ncbi:MAG: LicD family protein, partial [Lachnospiraceae bacterium]|nr:LicD family protein [Lachnospiraceae bacterium]